MAQHLNAITELKFRVTARSVRDRYTHLITKKANQLKYEEGDSEIEVIQTELDILLEEIIEREKDAKQQLELGVGYKKRKEENEKLSAEDICKQAMERMSQTAKRKEEEGSGDSSGVKKKITGEVQKTCFSILKRNCPRSMHSNKKSYQCGQRNKRLLTNGNERRMNGKIEHFSSRMK